MRDLLYPHEGALKETCRLIKGFDLKSNNLRQLELQVINCFNFNLSNIVSSVIYFERFAAATGDLIKPNSKEYCLGMYLLFMATWNEKIQFNYSQDLIAASCVHLLFRIFNKSDKHGCIRKWSNYLTEITGFR